MNVPIRMFVNRNKLCWIIWIMQRSLFSTNFAIIFQDRHQNLNSFIVRQLPWPHYPNCPWNSRKLIIFPSATTRRLHRISTTSDAINSFSNFSCNENVFSLPSCTHPTFLTPFWLTVHTEDQTSNMESWNNKF